MFSRLPFRQLLCALLSPQRIVNGACNSVQKCKNPLSFFLLSSEPRGALLLRKKSFALHLLLLSCLSDVICNISWFPLSFSSVKGFLLQTFSLLIRHEREEVIIWLRTELAFPERCSTQPDRPQTWRMAEREREREKKGIISADELKSEKEEENEWREKKNPILKWINSWEQHLHARKVNEGVQEWTTKEFRWRERDDLHHFSRSPHNRAALEGESLEPFVTDAPKGEIYVTTKHTLDVYLFEFVTASSDELNDIVVLCLLAPNENDKLSFFFSFYCIVSHVQILQPKYTVKFDKNCLGRKFCVSWMPWRRPKCIRQMIMIQQWRPSCTLSSCKENIFRKISKENMKKEWEKVAAQRPLCVAGNGQSLWKMFIQLRKQVKLLLSPLSPPSSAFSFLMSS